MGGLLGEEIDTAGRYIKHPPGSGTNDLQDGRPLDAGTVQIMDSNLSVLARENVRHLVWDPGFGTIPAVLNDGGRGYSGNDDVGQPIAGEYDDTNAPWASISWDTRTSRRYGPIFAIDDRALATPATGYGPREVRVAIDAGAATASSLTLYAALTASRGGAPVYPSDARIAFASATAASGRATTALALVASARALARVAWRCRAPTVTTATQYVQALEVTLWIGWRATNAADAVIAVSAFEIGGLR